MADSAAAHPTIAVQTASVHAWSRRGPRGLWPSRRRGLPPLCASGAGGSGVRVELEVTTAHTVARSSAYVCPAPPGRLRCGRDEPHLDSVTPRVLVERDAAHTASVQAGDARELDGPRLPDE